MTKYVLCKWEVNGPYDSDFYTAVWNDQTNEAESILTGTTRFASGPEITGLSRDLTPEVVENALTWLAGRIFDIIRAEDHRDIKCPDEVQIGERVRFTENHRNQDKEVIQEPCRACDGTGNWVNPRNDEDIRDCFKCKGTGYHEKKGEWKTGEDGKRAYITVEAGTPGTVEWVGTFRTIFSRGGYNQRNRNTLSTRVRLDNGTLVNVPLNKLRRDKEPRTDEELRQVADRLAQNAQFGKVLGPRHAWDSSNAVLSFLHGQA